jgi:hypothetical protein
VGGGGWGVGGGGGGVGCGGGGGGPRRPPPAAAAPPRQPNAPSLDAHLTPPQIYILTQFNSTSLNRHLARTYNMGSGVRFGGDGFVEVLAATQVPRGGVGESVGMGRSSAGRGLAGAGPAVRSWEWPGAGEQREGRPPRACVPHADAPLLAAAPLPAASQTPTDKEWFQGTAGARGRGAGARAGGGGGAGGPPAAARGRRRTEAGAGASARQPRLAGRLPPPNPLRPPATLDLNPPAPPAVLPPRLPRRRAPVRVAAG